MNLAHEHRDVLLADDLAVHFGGVKAVDGVRLRMRQGAIHGLIGPNGAGKSTVIDALTGRRKMAGGRVLLRGEDISSLGVAARRRRGLSRSFQRASVFGAMPVRGQLELACAMVDARDPAVDAQTLIAQLALEQVSRTDAGRLGYGEQRRLDLALALAGRPSVLLLDEPMAGLCAPECRELAIHLQELASRFAISLLLVEHDMDVVFGICDDITVMDMGRVIASGRPGEIRQDLQVRKCYLGTGT